MTQTTTTTLIPGAFAKACLNSLSVISRGCDRGAEGVAVVGSALNSFFTSTGFAFFVGRSSSPSSLEELQRKSQQKSERASECVLSLLLLLGRGLGCFASVCGDLRLDIRSACDHWLLCGARVHRLSGIFLFRVKLFRILGANVNDLSVSLSTRYPLRTSSENISSDSSDSSSSPRPCSFFKIESISLPDFERGFSSSLPPGFFCSGGSSSSFSYYGPGLRIQVLLYAHKHTDSTSSATVSG